VESTAAVGTTEAALAAMALEATVSAAMRAAKASGAKVTFQDQVGLLLGY
jgi:hypothetical protein